MGNKIGELPYMVNVPGLRTPGADNKLPEEKKEAPESKVPEVWTPEVKPATVAQGDGFVGAVNKTEKVDGGANAVGEFLDKLKGGWSLVGNAGDEEWQELRTIEVTTYELSDGKGEYGLLVRRMPKDRYEKRVPELVRTRGISEKGRWEDYRWGLSYSSLDKVTTKLEGNALTVKWYQKARALFVLRSEGERTTTFAVAPDGKSFTLKVTGTGFVGGGPEPDREWRFVKAVGK